MTGTLSDDPILARGRLAESHAPPARNPEGRDRHVKPETDRFLMVVISCRLLTVIP